MVRGAGISAVRKRDGCLVRTEKSILNTALWAQQSYKYLPLSPPRLLQCCPRLSLPPLQRLCFCFFFVCFFLGLFFHAAVSWSRSAPYHRSHRILWRRQRGSNGNEGPRSFWGGRRLGWSTLPTDYFLVSWQHSDRVSHMHIIITLYVTSSLEMIS